MNRQARNRYVSSAGSDGPLTARGRTVAGDSRGEHYWSKYFAFLGLAVAAFAIAVWGSQRLLAVPFVIAALHVFNVANGSATVLDALVATFGRQPRN